MPAPPCAPRRSTPHYSTCGVSKTPVTVADAPPQPVTSRTFKGTASSLGQNAPWFEKICLFSCTSHDENVATDRLGTR